MSDDHNNDDSRDAVERWREILGQGYEDQSGFKGWIRKAGRRVFRFFTGDRQRDFNLALLELIEGLDEGDEVIVSDMRNKIHARQIRVK